MVRSITVEEQQKMYTDDQDIVYCYDQVLDEWTPLASLPVRWFGLGQVKDKQVAIGRKRRCDGKATNQGYTFDDKSQK